MGLFKNLLCNRLGEPGNKEDLPKVFFNLSRSEKWGLRWLQSQQDLITVEADKNLGLVIMDKEDYLQRVKDELARTPEAYSKLPYSEEELHQRRSEQFSKLKIILSLLREEFGGAKLREYIMEPSTAPFNICHLHGLPKLHKPGTRMRLIYPFRSHPLGHLHKFIAKSLEPLVLRNPSVISHVLEVVEKVSRKRFPPGTLICSADIQSMYPNIDRDQALEVARRSLDQQEFRCFRGDSDRNWREILQLAHEDLEFELDGQLYKQIKGVPIGSPAGPQLAIQTLHTIISRRWAMLETEIYFGGIYFDDLFVIFKPGVDKDTAKARINYLLTGSSLSFDPESFNIMKVEELVSAKFNILDVALCFVQVENEFEGVVSVHCKEIGAYQYVPWRSAHPPSTKRGIIRGELNRRLRLTDTLDDWMLTTKDLTDKLIRRGYPEKVIQKQIALINFNTGRQLRDVLICKIRDRRTKLKFPFSGSLVEEERGVVPTIPLIIRYDPRSLRETKKRRRELEEVSNTSLDLYGRSLKKVRIVNAFTVGTRLGSIFNKKQRGSTPKPKPTLEIEPSSKVRELTVPLIASEVLPVPAESVPEDGKQRPDGASTGIRGDSP